MTAIRFLLATLLGMVAAYADSMEGVVLGISLMIWVATEPLRQVKA